MANVVHERTINTDDGGRGYGALILGVVLVILALLVAWWLFLSAASPLRSESNTTIIEQPATQETPDVNITPPADAPDVNVTPPTEAPDVNVVVPPSDAPSEDTSSQ